MKDYAMETSNKEETTRAIKTKTHVKSYSECYFFFLKSLKYEWRFSSLWAKRLLEDLTGKYKF